MTAFEGGALTALFHTQTKVTIIVRIMSSGDTTPAPAPAGTDPSPLTVGTQFVKKYYHVLSTSPADIDKFYKISTSVVTRGEGSDTAEVVATDFSDGAAAARFSSNDDEQIRFEFEHGAIDAQLSVNSGILLVVTGQVVYVSSNISKNFVHTFFLGSTVVGANNTKRSYYVHNDILRFLDLHRNQSDDTIVTQVEETPALDETSAVALTPKVEDLVVTTEPALIPDQNEELTSTVDIPVESNGQAPSVIKEDSVEEKLVDAESKVDEVDNDAPGHGVEESKVAILDDEVSATAKSSTAPTTTGSWASLVKRTAPTSASPPATPMRTEKPNTSVNGAAAIPQQPATTVHGKPALEPSTEPNMTTRTGPTSSAAEVMSAPPDTIGNKAIAHAKQQPAPVQQQFRPKREADCTLIIKNIDADVTEAEIKSMFEPFIADTSANFVGCTVHNTRGIAFVDYDSPEPVVKAVQQHAEAKFTIRGRELDVYQKIYVEKSQHRGGGNRFQGNSNNNGRDFYRSGGGGGPDGGGRSGGRNFRRGHSGRTAGRSSSAVASSGGN